MCYMTRPEKLQLICKIVENDILKRTPIDICDDTNLGENGLGLDSLKLLQLLSKIEKTMSVTIEDELWSLEKLHTVSDLLDHIFI